MGNWELCCGHLKFEAPGMTPSGGVKLSDIILWNLEWEINVRVFMSKW